jgi:hypothetical protein
MTQSEITSIAVQTDSQAGLNNLETRIQGRVGGRIRNLRLQLLGAGLVLSGLAHTYHAKQMAQHLVMTETNLPILANEIEVV